MSDQPFVIRVRATILLLLGTLVFPNSSPKHVKGLYGNFLINLDEINDYAWGEACLVEIHQSLQVCKETSQQRIGGSMSALTVFALEHLPSLKNLFDLREDPKEFPLIIGWAEILWKTMHKTRSDITTELIQQCINGLTAFSRENTVMNSLNFASNDFMLPYGHQESGKI
ncbi:OLC1v1024368C1 [Oldenlandia corymbosa var. corymbosa]|uniref:OLC1v1024368C1 n=1 Tax=Oldenlandia corymbosa var. corymbosa TaxID=529605 RepID=A0AAV1C2W7_OLDCO|nr:OLC1v1024368C1 [Oldenlandia corymbosa var. corymbosa]